MCTCQNVSNVQVHSSWILNWLSRCYFNLCRTNHTQLTNGGSKEKHTLMCGRYGFCRWRPLLARSENTGILLKRWNIPELWREEAGKKGKMQTLLGAATRETHLHKMIGSSNPFYVVTSRGNKGRSILHKVYWIITWAWGSSDPGQCMLFCSLLLTQQTPIP